MKKVASFDVDAQKGFTPLCPDELPVPDGDNIVEEINYVASKTSYRIGSKDAHPQTAVWTATKDKPMFTPLDYPNADLVWNRHCVVGTKGFELLDGLPKPEQYDYFVWKGQEPDLHPYGACFHDIQEELSTGVIEYIVFNKIDFVVVTGLAFDYCVATTAIQLSKAGIETCIYEPASKGIAKESCEVALAKLKEYNVSVLKNAKELESLLNKF